jgi:xanthine/uracil/vitamin C permease (AzgA family)
MDARGRDELGEGLEELKGREKQLGAAVHVGFREAVEEAAFGRREGGAYIESSTGVAAGGRTGRAIT